MRSCVDDVPASAASIVVQRDKLVGPSGRSEPLGVIAGMAFAMVTRASYGARLHVTRVDAEFQDSQVSAGGSRRPP